MGNMQSNGVVWIEIPVTNMDRAKAFYGKLLDAPLTDHEGGPNPMAMLPNGPQSAVSGHLYPGTPAVRGRGPTVHLAVSADAESAMDRIAEGGGEVISPVISIPSGSFFYAIDTEGNSLGVFHA
ncbi:MAG: VOC family protein [Pseudomonadota bacterium]